MPLPHHVHPRRHQASSARHELLVSFNCGALRLAQGASGFVVMISKTSRSAPAAVGAAGARDARDACIQRGECRLPPPREGSTFAVCSPAFHCQRKLTDTLVLSLAFVEHVATFFFLRALLDLRRLGFLASTGEYPALGLTPVSALYHMLNFSVGLHPYEVTM